MSFAFKVAPGVRVRATGRGLRASLGGQEPLVDVGDPGGSDPAPSAAPWAPGQGGSLGRGGAAVGRATAAARELRLRQAQQRPRARELRRAVRDVLDLHRQEFPPAAPPVAPPPAPVDEAEVRRRREREALAGIGLLQRSARRAARRRAAGEAADEIVTLQTERRRQQEEQERRLDEDWRRLLAGDQQAVLAALTKAFEASEARAAPVGAFETEISVALLAPDLGLVPDRMPERAGARSWTLRRLDDRERHAFYLQLLCGHVLAAARAALAAAPSAESVRVAAVRASAPDAHGVRHAECLLAAAFTRAALRDVAWDAADAATIVRETAAELRLRCGETQEMSPLDPGGEPELAVLLGAVDLAGFTSGAPPVWEPPRAR